jgi:23S rRNA (guanosine2251-2'-O)-methyltransferase
MNADFHFVECENDACRLRFPLDLIAFKGNYCPRCGSRLRVASTSTPSQPSGPSSITSQVTLIGLLDNIRSSHNVGSIFRSADGTGFSHLYLCGITPTPDHNPEIAKTALGAEKAVAWSYHTNAVDLARSLQLQGFGLIALERCARSKLIQALHLSPKLTYVLMVGSEPAGVDPDLLQIADQVVSLPMLGVKESLNVAVSFSIAAYWLRLTS